MNMNGSSHAQKVKRKNTNGAGVCSNKLILHLLSVGLGALSTVASPSIKLEMIKAASQKVLAKCRATYMHK